MPRAIAPPATSAAVRACATPAFRPECRCIHQGEKIMSLREVAAAQKRKRRVDWHRCGVMEYSSAEMNKRRFQRRLFMLFLRGGGVCA